MLRFGKLVYRLQLILMFRCVLIVVFLLLGYIPILAQQGRLRDMLELPAYSANMSEQFIRHQGYVVSYNKKHRIPNWVAWQLYPGRLQGGALRQDVFMPDPSVVNGSPGHHEYTNSGYDRGHMCPAGDNSFSSQAMKESFYTSNICPQLHILNGGSWRVLEERCRKWTNMYQRLYIVCGPIIQRAMQKIGGDRGISIPKLFFKAVLREAKGQYYMIGYMFRQNGNWWVASIDEIEQQTGLNLFHNLPSVVQQELEAKKDVSNWLHWDR